MNVALFTAQYTSKCGAHMLSGVLGATSYQYYKEKKCVLVLMPRSKSYRSSLSSMIVNDILKIVCWKYTPIC